MTHADGASCSCLRNIARAWWHESRLFKAQTIVIPALIAAAFLLSGCAASYTWTRPGGDQAQLDRDSYSCERDAAMLPYAPGPIPIPPPHPPAYTANIIGSTAYINPVPSPANSLMGLSNSMAGLAHVLGDRARRDAMFERCLGAHGWAKVRENRPRPAPGEPEAPGLRHGLDATCDRAARTRGADPRATPGAFDHLYRECLATSAAPRTAP